MNKNINVKINYDSIFRLFFVIFLILAIWKFQALALILLTSVVIASAIEPAIIAFQKIKVSRIFAVAIVYIILIFSIFVFSAFLIPPIVDQTSNLITDLPVWLEGLGEFLEEKKQDSEFFASFFSSFEEKFIDSPSVENLGSLDSLATSFKNFFFGFAGAFFGGLLNFFLIIILSFYFAIQDHGIDSFLKIITPVKYQNYIIDLWKRSQRKIGRWMIGQFILAAIMGSITFVGLWLIGVPNALLLATLAALAEFVPVLGPMLAAIPALFIAFISGGVGTLGVVAVFYLVLQQIENNFLYPMVVKNLVGVPALLVIISLIIGAELFGFLGIILSIPIAAAFMEFIKDVEKKQEKEIARGLEKEVDLTKN